MKFLLFFSTLVLAIIILTYNLRSVVNLETKYFSRADEVDERILTMKKACLKYAEKHKLVTEHTFSRVDRFSIGCPFNYFLFLFLIFCL